MFLVGLLQEICLSEVLQVRGPVQLSVPSASDGSGHCFEVVTASQVLCVVAGDEGPSWENAIRQAMMPVQSSSRPEQESHGEQGMFNDTIYSKTG